MNDDNIIIEEIKFFIKINKYKKGNKLPSERCLCELFNVSRFSLRKSLRHLVETNYLYVKDKSGYYFNGDRLNISVNNISDFFSQNNANRKIILSKNIKADKNISKRMNIPYESELTQTILMYNFDSNHTSVINTFIYPIVEDQKLKNIDKLIKNIIDNSEDKKGKIYVRDANEFELQLICIENNQKICRWISTYNNSYNTLYIEVSMNIHPFKFFGW